MRVKCLARECNPDHSIQIPVSNVLWPAHIPKYETQFQITFFIPYRHMYIIYKDGKVEHGHSCLLHFVAELHHKTYSSTVSPDWKYGLWVQLGAHKLLHLKIIEIV